LQAQRDASAARFPLNPIFIKEKTAMRVFASIFHLPVFKSYWSTLALFFILALASPSAQAQSLGYEGPTGVFVTPLALVSASPAKGLGQPSVAYHFLAGGPIIGDFSTVSITEGFAKRFEFGYTSEIHAGGATPYFPGTAGIVTAAGVPGSSLFASDLDIVHGKATIVAENAGKTKWVPAIAVGTIFRFNDHDVFNGPANGGAGTNGFSSHNADVYVVATKVVTQFTKKVPWLLSAGVRGTNASLWGLGGNAPDFSARAFGALAFIFTGPNKSTIILGSEVSQQPQRIKNPLGVNFDIPTSEVYAVRFVPSPKHKLNIDAGVLQAANKILALPTTPPGLYVNARSRVAFGISYGF
jgi:hypothetical protein